MRVLLPLLFIKLFVHNVYSREYECDQTAPCGCPKTVAIANRVVNGTEAVEHSWEWAVSLRLKGLTFCGGTILNDRFVLTAAHCMVHYSGYNITVCAATHRSDEQCSQSRSVAEIINHPEYRGNQNRGPHDISLLRLSSPLDFSAGSHTSAICLPNSIKDPNNYPPSGNDVIAIGWGRLAANGPTSKTLQEVPLRILDSSELKCKRMRINNNLQICAAGDGKSTCPGDSGGPIMHFHPSARWELVGITSFGPTSCKDDKGSSIYTRVTAYRSFIDPYLRSKSPISTLTPTPTYTCKCECPWGRDSGLAYIKSSSVEACIEACKAVPSNPCSSSNTYACLGTRCAYSPAYITSTLNPTSPSTLAPTYTCKCECPWGRDSGLAYTKTNSAGGCIEACKAVSSNPCSSSNTYACLGTRCAYSPAYMTLSSNPTIRTPCYQCINQNCGWYDCNTSGGHSGNVGGDHPGNPGVVVESSQSGSYRECINGRCRYTS